MVDRVVESSDVEVPEIPETLEKVLLFVLEEAKEKLTQGSDVVPFTALVVKENLFIENHPGFYSYLYFSMNLCNSSNETENISGSPIFLR